MLIFQRVIYDSVVCNVSRLWDALVGCTLLGCVYRSEWAE